MRACVWFFWFFLSLFSIFESLSDLVLISQNITIKCTLCVCVSMCLKNVKSRERKQTGIWVPVPGMHILIFFEVDLIQFYKWEN